VAQRFLTVKVTSCFARGFIQGAVNFTQYVIDGYFGIVKRRKPPLYPHARHSEILQFQRLIVPIHQPEMTHLITRLPEIAARTLRQFQAKRKNHKGGRPAKSKKPR